MLLATSSRFLLFRLFDLDDSRSFSFYVVLIDRADAPQLERRCAATPPACKEFSVLRWPASRFPIATYLLSTLDPLDRFSFLHYRVYRSTDALVAPSAPDVFLRDFAYTAWPV